MSLHHQYINNESISESPINEFEDIFENYNVHPPSLKEALIDMFTSSGGGIKQALYMVKLYHKLISV